MLEILDKTSLKSIFLNRFANTVDKFETIALMLLNTALKSIDAITLPIVDNTTPIPDDNPLKTAVKSIRDSIALNPSTIELNPDPNAAKFIPFILSATASTAVFASPKTVASPGLD